MAVPKYELVVIFDPFLADADYETETQKLVEQITKRGGVHTNTDVWGRKRLAYPIEKKVEGYYVLVAFEGQVSGADLADLESQIRLNERVLREMVSRIPEARKPRRKPKAPKAPRVVSESFSAGSAGASSGRNNG
jgi:small subunit ribosomal protein S6